MTNLLPTVAALIVSYNTRDTLRGTLSALLPAMTGGLEVVVVDNQSSDGSPEMVAADFPAVRLVRAGDNIGLGRGTNLAAQHTERALLLLLNPDCRASAEAIQLMAVRLEADPALGFVGPLIRKESGAIDAACLRGDPDPVGALLYLTRVSRLRPGSAQLNRYNLTHLDTGREQELLNGTGACLLFRATAFHEVRGFDPDFFMYGEDLDLCRRVRQAGHPGRFVPAAEVVHIKGESTRRHSTRMLMEFHRAMWIYYSKHEARRRALPVNALVAVGIGGLALARLATNAVRRDKRVSAR